VFIKIRVHSVQLNISIQSKSLSETLNLSFYIQSRHVRSEPSEERATMNRSRFVVIPIPESEINDLRLTGRDDPGLSRSQCYKMFYSRNLLIFVTS
jgi:hypothetical protein